MAKPSLREVVRETESYIETWQADVGSSNLNIVAKELGIGVGGEALYAEARDDDGRRAVQISVVKGKFNPKGEVRIIHENKSGENYSFQIKSYSDQTEFLDAVQQALMQWSSKSNPAVSSASGLLFAGILGYAFAKRTR